MFTKTIMNVLNSTVELILKIIISGALLFLERRIKGEMMIFSFSRFDFFREWIVFEWYIFCLWHTTARSSKVTTSHILTPNLIEKTRINTVTNTSDTYRHKIILLWVCLLLPMYMERFLLSFRSNFNYNLVVVFIAHSHLKWI